MFFGPRWAGANNEWDLFVIWVFNNTRKTEIGEYLSFKKVYYCSISVFNTFLSMFYHNLRFEMILSVLFHLFWVLKNPSFLFILLSHTAQWRML